MSYNYDRLGNTVSIFKNGVLVKMIPFVYTDIEAATVFNEFVRKEEELDLTACAERSR